MLALHLPPRTPSLCTAQHPCVCMLSSWPCPSLRPSPRRLIPAGSLPHMANPVTTPAQRRSDGARATSPRSKQLTNHTSWSVSSSSWKPRPLPARGTTPFSPPKKAQAWTRQIPSAGLPRLSRPAQHARFLRPSRAFAAAATPAAKRPWSPTSRIFKLFFQQYTRQSFTFLSTGMIS